MKICLFIKSNLFKITVAVYPPHIDFQKENVFIDGEKFSIVIPKLHEIQDRAEELRRNIKQNSKNTIFEDDKGLRHIWSEMKDNRSYKRNGNENLETNNDTMIFANMVTVSNSSLDVNPLNSNTNLTNSTSVNKGRKRIKRKRKKIKKSGNMTVKEAIRQGANENKSTLVKTTFYCPFLGILTMNHVIH